MTKQSGHSLIEFVIASAIGAVLLTQALTLFSHRVAAQTQHIGQLRLNQELRAIVDIMAGDIRRHGFWESISKELNPHASIHIDDHCIIVSYDRNRNGAENVDTGETIAYRWRDNKVQTRNNTRACDNGRWEALNDHTTIVISKLEFSYTDNAACLNLSHSPSSSCSPSDCSYQAWRSGDTLARQWQINLKIEAYQRSAPQTLARFEDSIHIANPVYVVADNAGPSGEHNDCT